MPAPLTLIRAIITERVAASAIAVLVALLWALDQVSTVAAVAVAGLSAIFFLQIEFKWRLELLKFRSFDTERREVQNLRGIQSLRTAALNSVPSPIILLDRQHRVVAANGEAQTLFSASLIGEDIFLFFRKPAIVKTIRRLLEHGRSDRDRATVRHTTNNDRTFEVTAAVIERDEKADSSAPRLMLFFFEITSLLRTEQMRVDFVANASHELRTPLSSLMGSIETLQGPARDDPEGQERFLSIMQRESERMARLIDDLLSLSRIELLRHEAPENAVDPKHLLHGSLNALMNVGKERGMSFQVDAPDTLPNVLADEDQMMQVFLNLLVNAAKYADPKTTVHLTAALTDNRRHVVFSVRDEGPGIAPEHLGRLTERFYRIDTARSRKMGGTGLGLAIVKHILLRHESQMDIRSKVGEGTEFLFKLAVAEAPDMPNGALIDGFKDGSMDQVADRGTNLEVRP